MNVAVCFSGQLRGFEFARNAIKEYFLDLLPNYTAFFYCDRAPEHVNHWNIGGVQFVRDHEKSVDMGLLRNAALKTGRERLILQVHDRHAVNRMSKDFEKRSNIPFSHVARIRPDCAPVVDFPIESIRNNAVNIPDFHHWGGTNDRFAFGTRETMDVYFDFHRHQPENASGRNAEVLFKLYLESAGIRIHFLRFYFNRIKADGGIWPDVQDIETR